MGYNTEFSGKLFFNKEISVKELKKLNAYMGEDCRDHPEWMLEDEDFTYIDLKVSKDMDGLEWDETEKSYDMVEKVNLVIREMKKEFPEFGLTGMLLAQGSEIDDRWKLEIGEDGWAKEVPIVVNGRKIRCPHCDEDFYLENDE